MTIRSRRSTLALVAGVASTLAATSIALTPGLAGAATHGSARTSSAARMSRLDVVVRSTSRGPQPSVSRIRPGNTVFHVDNAGVGGGIELVRLRRGYTMSQLLQDAQGLFAGNMPAIRRIDHRVIFFGGMQAGHHARFATYVGRGTYYLLNLDHGTYSKLVAAGSPQRRMIPRTYGHSVAAVGADTFQTSRRLPATGWISWGNRTDEPHFMDFDKVRSGTTHAQVSRWIKGGAQGQPKFGLSEFHGALVVSPGHRMEWYVGASRGEYFLGCWWPSDENGMPHALMGMWSLVHLR